MIPEFPLKVLLVEDERPVRDFLTTMLGANYRVFQAECGREALESVTINQPDVVVLDLGLPDMDGLDVTRRLREWSQVPVIVISVRSQEEDKVAALDAGADDYLTKPFGVRELQARIRAALRHPARAENESVYHSGALTVDLVRREVSLNHRLVQLTPTEYDILRTLIYHAGKVLTHEQLIREVWGGEGETSAHLLRVNVSNLRRKIEEDSLRPEHIITEPGVGYRLRDLEKSSYWK